MLVILLQSLHYIMNPPSDKYGLDMEEGALQSGASFRLPLESYTGIRSPLLWTTPSPGCTALGRAIASKFGRHNSPRRAPTRGAPTDCQFL